MRIAITGYKGQLGQALQRTFDGHDILGIDLPEHDITDPHATSEALVAWQPDLVVHTAAMTDVDGCQQNPDLAFRVNTFGTHNVALASARSGAEMVHISTNEVFDGRLGRPYYEWDTPSPLSIYARSKAGAEFYVRNLLTQYYVVRTSWVYARGGSNFVTKIIAAADRHGALRVVIDEISAPTYAPDLADAIGQLVETQQYGVYHLTNAGFCSRYDWARKILELAGRDCVPIERITTDQWPRPAPPPLYAPIINFAAAALGITLRPWQEALQAYFSDD